MTGARSTAHESRHLGVFIPRSADEVYAFAAHPANLPAWAAGLAAGVQQRDGRWYADSPMGRVEIRFAPANPFGVLDHEVITADGTTTDNPLRVIPDDGGCEIVFTVRRRGRSRAEFDQDADAVQQDLLRLRDVWDAGSPGANAPDAS